MEFAQRPRAGLTKPGWPMRLTHERPAAVSACPPVCLSSCPLVCLSACPPVLLPASGAPNETAEQGDRQVPGCRSGGRVAGWPGGRVTGWPGGRVAGWPGGWVAGWLGSVSYYAPSCGVNASTYHQQFVLAQNGPSRAYRGDALGRGLRQSIVCLLVVDCWCCSYRHF